MKITDVEVIKWNPGVGKNFIYVKLSTDEGIIGWGEAYSQADRDTQVETHINQLARYLVDRPEEPRSGLGRSSQGDPAPGDRGRPG